LAVEPVEGDGGGVAGAEFGETGVTQGLGDFGRCDEKTETGVARLRYGIDNGFGFTLQDIVDGETAARFEDAVDFAVEARLVGDVHGGVLGPGVVEGFAGEGHVEGVGGEEVRGKSGAEGQVVGDGGEVRGEVDAGDSAVVSGGEVAGGSAESGANVEDGFTGLGTEGFGEFAGGGKPAEMELVEGCELGPVEETFSEAGFAE